MMIRTTTGMKLQTDAEPTLSVTLVVMAQYWTDSWMRILISVLVIMIFAVGLLNVLKWMYLVAGDAFLRRLRDLKQRLESTLYIVRPIRSWSDLTTEEAALLNDEVDNQVWLTNHGWNTSRIFHTDSNCQHVRAGDVKTFRRCLQCRTGR